LRIGGIYRTKNIENMVATLPEILPIKLNGQLDGFIKISSSKIN
jgi:ferric-dicitrate binding protein FerR (iron transport regulator)